MCPPDPTGSSRGRLARYTPDSRRWRRALAGVSAVVALVLFYYTVRLIGSAWSGTLPSLLVLVGSTLTLLAAATVPTMLLAPDERAEGRADAEDDAIAELKRRYAAGRISEAEFERRLETLLETPDESGRPPADRGESAVRESTRAESERG